MNKGMDMASGRLVVFMNAGDAFASSDVLRMMARSYVEDGGWRWGYGCGRVISEEGPTSVISLVPFSQDRLGLGLATVPHQAVVMETALLVDLGGFDESVGLAADQELIYRASFISKPKLWAEFFVDFEGGGAGSTRDWWELPREMRTARRRLRTPVGGSWAKDGVLSAGVLGYRGFLNAQRRFRDRIDLS